jgi:hypothetical protein
VSSPTTCGCVVSFAEVCDIVLSATNGDMWQIKRRAMAIITSKKRYKDIELAVVCPIDGQTPRDPSPGALRMAAGLNDFWSIMWRLPLHEFILHWIALLFLRQVPVYVCIHQYGTRKVCPDTLQLVLTAKHGVSVVIQGGLWNCTSRDTIAYEVLFPILGIAKAAN